MKIVMQRPFHLKTFHSTDLSTIDYLESVFSPIGHLGALEKISIKKLQFSEMITLSMELQSGVDFSNLEKNVRETIAKQSDLKLVSIEVTKKCIQVPGLTLISKTPDDVATYQVHFVYAFFLANNLSYAVRCTKPESYAVDVLLETSDQHPDLLTSTGKVTISSRKSLSGGLMNAYNKFAQIIVNDSDIRQRILDHKITVMRFTLNPDGSSQINTIGCSVQPASPSPTMH